jgi:hypothetical protein
MNPMSWKSPSQPKSQSKQVIANRFDKSEILHCRDDVQLALPKSTKPVVNRLPIRWSLEVACFLIQFPTIERLLTIIAHIKSIKSSEIPVYASPYSYALGHADTFQDTTVYPKTNLGATGKTSRNHRK